MNTITFAIFFIIIFLSSINVSAENYRTISSKILVGNKFDRPIIEKAYKNNATVKMSKDSRRAYKKLNKTANKKLSYKQIKKDSKKYARNDYKVRIATNGDGCRFTYKDVQIRQKKDGSLRFEKALVCNEKGYSKYFDLYTHVIPKYIVKINKFLTLGQIKECKQKMKYHEK